MLIHNVIHHFLAVIERNTAYDVDDPRVYRQVNTYDDQYHAVFLRRISP